MASAYGIVHQYGEPQSNFDPQLAAGVLQYKQEKYDTNLMKVEQTLAQLGMTTSMLVRPEDREYMADKVNNLINSIPALKDTDYSSNESTREIVSQVNKALDTRIIKNLGYSQAIRNYNEQTEELKKEGLYSEVNYIDGLKNAGYEEYMSGAEDLGSLNYTPYVDLPKALLEKIELAKKQIGEREVETKLEDGTIVNKKVSNFTIAEWAKFMPNLITPEMDAQMKVEARALYNWDKGIAAETVQGAIDESVQMYQEKIEGYQTILDTKELSPKKEKELREEIASYKSIINDTKTAYQINNISATSVGHPIIRNRMINEYAALAGSDPSITYSSIPKGAASSAASTREQMMQSGIGITPSSMLATDFKDYTLEDFENQKKADEEQAFAWTNKAKEDIKNNFDSKKYESVVKLYTDKGASQKQAETQAAIDIYKKNNNLEKANEGYKFLSDLNTQNLIEEEAINDFTLQGAFTENQEDWYDALIGEGSSNTTLKVSTNGKEIPVRQYLKGKGIETKEQLNEFFSSDKSKELKANILADFVIESVGEYSGEVSPKLKHDLSRLNKALGTDYEVEDIYEFTAYTSANSGILSQMTGNAARSFNAKIKEEDNEIISLLKNRSKYVNSTTFVDGNFTDDNFIDKALSFNSKKYKENYTEAIKESVRTVTTPRKITVDAADGLDEKKSIYLTELQNIVADVLAEGAFVYQKEKPTTIYADPSNPDNIIISQLDSVDREDSDAIKENRFVARVERSQLREMSPNLYNAIDFDNTETGIKTAVDKEVEQTEISYKDFTNKETHLKYLGFFNNNPQAVDRMSSIQTKRILKRNFSEIYDAGLGGLVLDKAINNSDRFKVKLSQKKEGQNYVQVYFDTTPNEKDIDKKEYKLMYDMGDLNSYGIKEEELMKFVNISPQIFLSYALENITMDFRNSNYDITDEENKFVYLYNALNKDK